MITVGIAGLKTDEFVEIERSGAAEIRPPGAVQPHELAIQRNRRGPGRQPKDDGRLRGQQLGDMGGQRSRDTFRCVEDADLHERQSRLYLGTLAPPRASASASHTAPMAGSASSTCTVHLGATSMSRCGSSRASQGTTLKAPPAR